MDYKGYQYMIMKNGTIIKNISAVILYVDGLIPGTCYLFSVITLAADGTESAGVNAPGCTGMYCGWCKNATYDLDRKNAVYMVTWSWSWS